MPASVGWLKCVALARSSLTTSDSVENDADLWVYRTLMRSAYRTLDPDEATLFYIPVFPVRRRRSHSADSRGRDSCISASTSSAGPAPSIKPTSTSRPRSSTSVKSIPTTTVAAALIISSPSRPIAGCVHVHLTR